VGRRSPANIILPLTSHPWIDELVNTMPFLETL
jgi:hypothetical protein